MRIRCAVALAVLMAAPAHAYDIDTLTRDMQAHHEKMMQELGDLTITQSVTIEAPGAGTSNVESTMYRKGDRWRMEGMMSGGPAGDQPIETTILFDGEETWSAVMGMKMKIPAGTMAQASAADPWAAPPAGSVLVGEETVDGRDCWVVEGPEPPAGSGIPTAGKPKTWFDKKSFVTVRSEVMVSGKPMRSTFSDFRAVGGYEVPYAIDVYSGDQHMMHSTITEIATSTGLSDDLFDPEKLAGADGPDMQSLMKQAEEMQKRMMESRAKGGD